MEDIKSVITNNIETLHKLDLEYNIVMHQQQMLMENQRDIKILTNAEGERKLKEAFKKEYEEIIGMGKSSRTIAKETKFPNISTIGYVDHGKTTLTTQVRKTIQEVLEEEKSIKLTNPYSNLPPTSYNLQSLSKKRNSNYTPPKKKRKKK
jgi:hypothetical protein